MKKVWIFIIVISVCLGGGLYYKKQSASDNEQLVMNEQQQQSANNEPKQQPNNNEKSESEEPNKELTDNEPPVIEEQKKEEQKQESTSNISNKKISWSFVRKKDNTQPTFNSEQYNLAKKYDAIFLGDKESRNIYLTFDEGYENGYTPKILDTLRDNDVKATFFITYPYLQKELALVERMLAEGHTVGNHSWNHPSMPEITDDKKLEEEFLKLDRDFTEKTGADMKFFRAPMGEFSERTLKMSRELGYRDVFWSFAYADWDVKAQKGADNAIKMVNDNIHNGAVLLLHAVSSDNADGLDTIIKQLKEKGYIFSRLEDFK